jgi:hypothetical protein
MKRQGELMEQMRQREIEKIRAEGEDKVDVALVDKYIALQKEAPKYEEGDEPDEKASEKYESHYRRVQREIGPHLGQVAMKGDKPALGADRFSASTGFVRREGLLISARFVRFSSSIDGAPAMTRWLIDQGCRQVKYEFKGMGEVEAGDFAFE